MNGYLLDTNIFAEVRKKERCHQNVSTWFASIDDDLIYTSVLVVGEICRGIELARQNDKSKAQSLNRWLCGLLSCYEDRVLPITEEIALQWGKLSINEKLPDIDGLLAATAIVHNLTLVTRNTKDFERSHINLIDPFEEKST